MLTRLPGEYLDPDRSHYVHMYPGLLKTAVPNRTDYSYLKAQIKHSATSRTVPYHGLQTGLQFPASSSRRSTWRHRGLGLVVHFLHSQRRRSDD